MPTFDELSAIKFEAARFHSLSNVFVGVAVVVASAPYELTGASPYDSRKSGPFPSCPKPLFQCEAKWEAIDMKMFFILIQMKLIFTRKVLHLALFLKVSVFGILRDIFRLQVLARF